MDAEDNFIFEDISIINDRRVCRRRKVYKDRKNPFQIYSNEDFIELYRFNKEIAMFIVNLIKDDLNISPELRGSPISAEIMTMATLRYIEKGSCQKDIGDAHGISQQTMSRIIKKVVAALARQIPNFIKFSLEPSDLQKTKEGFYNIAQFPQCIGAIDCTHIKIRNPGGELGGRHRCRKGFYSINVQVICDSNFKIVDIVARWRGSAHDSRIWRESWIKQRLENSDLSGGVLLGDNGYPCSNILLTPFRISENLQRQQQQYNKSHILTRNVIETLFGQLKNKFRCCFNGITVDLQTAKNMIIAIAVLHNIARDNALPFADDCSEEEPMNEIPNTEENHEEIGAGTGHEFRQNFVNKYFS